MGLLDKLFGGGHDYPPLPENGLAMSRIDEIHNELETLTHKVRDPLEIVPAEHAAYVFAWIHDGKVTSLKEMIDENHLSPGMVEQLIEELREAYTHAQDAPRYSAHIGDKEVVVIPSEGLESEVHEILEHTVH